jgi:alkylation response protein AidB-like acyl-CoA dehydrogenase
MVRLARRDVTLRSVSGMDPSLGLVEVEGEYTAGDREDLSPDAWTDAVAVSQLALSHELIGGARAMLALARDHAVERIQFGQPIAQFQAVRHRLADTYVAIESAEAAVDAAWDDGSALAAAIAKAVAGRNARLAARHCQQVLAGIGFTAEHAFHGYLRRVLVLEQLFGDARSLTVTVGEDLLRTRQVPPLLPL